MASYNEIDGVPSHANRWLLRDVLRKEWGFKGFVVSDYYAIWELQLPARHARPFRRQGQEGSLRAGGRGRRQHRIARAGLLSAPGRTGAQRRAEGIAARRTGRADAATGNSRWACSTIRTSIPTRPSAWSAATSIASWRCRPRAKRITLLKNDNNLLPLDADETQDHRRHRPERRPQSCSAATAACPSTTSRCSTASRRSVGDRVKVLYSEGCKITVGGVVEPG